MKKLILLLFVFTGLTSYSQTTKLEGTLQLDSTASAFGQFIVFSLPDSALVKGSYIDSTYFSTEFQAEANKSYYVKISLAGYQDTLISFEANKPVVSLGTITFSSDRTLTTVDIVYKKPEFQRTMDGIKINVEGTTLQTLSTLYDVLIASPKISSPDGERIEIVGKGSPLILIDRQAIISNAELKAIPANMVESVEIMTNPSAKYKGQGASGGVIEVITKNFAMEGYNMNVSASAGINTQQKPTASLNYGLNLKRKKFSMNGYLGGNYDTSNGFGSSSGTTTDDSERSLSSEYTNKNVNSWMYYQFKMAYQIKPKQKITSGVRGYGSFGNSESSTVTNYFVGNLLETSNSSYADPNYVWMNNSAFINYQVETDTNKSNLEVNLNLVQKTSNNSGTSLNTYQNTATGQYADFSIKTASYDRPLVGEVRLNYEHIFDTSGWELNAGFSYSELRNAKIYDQYSRVNSDWVKNDAYSNSYDYKEHLGTIYTEVSKDWKKLGFRAGITGEYTGLDGYSNSLQKQFIDSVYIRPFPSASLLYQPNEKVGLTLGYTSGIQRPEFSNYDPFVRVQDSLSISYGNPNLRPATSHSLRLETDLLYMYNFSVYVTQVSRPISQLSFVDDSTFLTNTIAWNAKLDRSIGADISVPLQFSWLDGWNSVWFSYDEYTFGPEFGRAPFSTVSYGIYSYLNFKLPKDFSIMSELQVYRWGSAEYTSNARINWGGRITKKYKNNDLQFYLEVSNLFPPKYKSTQYYGNYIFKDSGRYEFTAFKLGMYYKFGRLKQADQIQESSSGQSGRL